eukprot:4855060-Prymnesium_polylepis.1
MLQRSAGLVVSEESILGVGMNALYSEDAIERGITHELAEPARDHAADQAARGAVEARHRADEAAGCGDARGTGACRLSARLWSRRHRRLRQELPAGRRLLHRRR